MYVAQPYFLSPSYTPFRLRLRATTDKVIPGRLFLSHFLSFPPKSRVSPQDLVRQGSYRRETKKDKQISFLLFQSMGDNDSINAEMCVCGRIYFVGLHVPLVSEENTQDTRDLGMIRLIPENSIFCIWVSAYSQRPNRPSSEPERRTCWST